MNLERGEVVGPDNTAIIMMNFDYSGQCTADADAIAAHVIGFGLTVLVDESSA